MKIAVLSDTHSRTAATLLALATIAERGIGLILHCGDLEDDDTVRLFPAHTHFVLGNCDHDRDGIRSAVAEIGATLHDPLGNLEVVGRKLGFVHGDDKGLLDAMTKSGAFDYVFHGHTHLAKNEMVGRTRVINPGALHRARPKSFVILDAATGAVESINIE